MEELHLSKKTSYEKETTDNPLNVNIKKAPIFRRFLAFLSDLLLVFIVFILAQSTIVEPIANKSFGMEQASEDYKNRLIDSELYITDSNGATWQLDQYYDTAKKNDATLNAFTYYNQPIVNYYTNFETSNSEGLELINIKEYYTQIKGATALFTYTESGEGDSYVFTYSPLASYEESSMKLFMEKAYETALNSIANDEILLTLSKKIIYAQIIELLICLVVSNIIFFFVIPLCTPRRQTVGQLMLKIAVASRGTGFVAKRSQIIVNFVVFFFLEVIGSFFLVLIPGLVSFTMMAFTKEHHTIHNYLSATIVVDVREERLFKNEHEALEHEAALQDANDNRYVNRYQELNLGNKDEKKD